ncbi:SsgA family sporulation/cell division regulator [Streptomyces sp. NPDC046887]|uniref:SsgA family sporulation/cell division regulator n=1 Tax=Streptomyces sp. NPDC046887 TaxID=3155472 RepID=UPI0033CC7315
MSVRKHHTEVQAADGLAADDFDALLRASSLGAPHVLAETEPIPPAVRHRLDQAAAAPPPVSPEPAATGAAEPESPLGPPRPVAVLSGGTARQRAAASSRLVLTMDIAGSRAEEGMSAGIRGRLRTLLYEVLESAIATDVTTLGGRRQTGHAYPCGLLTELPRVLGQTPAYVIYTDSARGTPLLNSPQGIDWRAAADRGIVRDLSVLTLHLWRMPGCDRAVRPPFDTLVAAYPDGLAEPFPAMCGPGFARPRPEEPDGCTAGTPFVVWNGIRSAMEHLSTGLLQERPWPDHPLPPAEAGLPPDPARRRFEVAPPDLMPVWRALAACWSAQHTTMFLRLHTDEDDPGRPLTARFTYRTMDPYAVEIVFHPRSPDAKRWVFARELLLTGLDRSAGDGNVTVRPRPSPGSGGGTFIQLRSAQGTALLSAPRTDLEEYLERTQRTVPRGRETEHRSETLENLERELASLAPGAVG